MSNQDELLENGLKFPPGALVVPQVLNEFRRTPIETIEEAIHTCKSQKNKWLQVGIEERITILEQITRDLASVGERWVDESINAKGIPKNSYGHGEEWFIFSFALRAARLLRRSLDDIQNHGRPRIPGKVYSRPDGQVVAQVFPQTWENRLFFQSTTGEVWMQPGVTTEEVFQSQARAYTEKNFEGKVALVLAAGNVAILSVLDFLHKLFVENHVVLLKINPVNEYLGPIFEVGFQALNNRGFLHIIYGGAQEGSYICNHPDVDEIHLTGSDKTFEAIVYGTGPEVVSRKMNKDPINTKPITAELGNITPVIVVPGPWDDHDIEYQALQIASWFSGNSSFNCLTPRVLIQHKDWNKRSSMIDAIGKLFNEIETRSAYYLGAEERFALFMAEHPDAHQYGSAKEGYLPWTVITDVDPTDLDDICFRCESFCSIMAETALEAPTVPEFIHQAVEFANNNLWGTLAATILVHPKSMQDPEIASAVDQAISRLRYGTIGVNMRIDAAYYLMLTTWGAFPGQPDEDIQSGRGTVHNYLMFDRPQKSVIQGPFIRSPDPFTVRSKTIHDFARKVALYEASPSLWKLPGLLWSAMRS
ncbi:MAG: aldehyde dehydrogenase family protein [Anaerolineales bacterium]|nr:aldehyde dehydrogenase family protein [Anaerolineales bacterium]